jgi:hypothetical protein
MSLSAAILAIAALAIPPMTRAQTPMGRAMTADSMEAASPAPCLCENAWDFNAPFAVPGFGPLRPSDVEASLALIGIGTPSAFAGTERLATELKHDGLHIQR